jgi:hypothetical protein
MDENIHVEALNVAFADKTSEFGPKKGFFARITSTFIDEKAGSGPSPIAFRMLIPLRAIA